MAVAAKRKIRNIRSTVQLRIGDTITADGTDYTVFHSWRWADPDEVRNPGTDGLAGYVTTTWLQDLAGRKSSSLVQVDIWTRIGGEGDADGDPLGIVALEIADAIEGVFAGSHTRWCFPMLDFTADPLNPVEVNEFLVCQTSDGRDGLPEARSGVLPSDGLNRITMTLRFRNMLDHAGPAARVLE